MSKIFNRIFSGFLLLALRSDKGYLFSAFSSVIMFLSLLFYVDLLIGSAVIFKTFNLYNNGLEYSQWYGISLSGLAFLAQCIYFFRQKKMETYSKNVLSQSKNWKVFSVTSAVVFGILSIASLSLLPWAFDLPG